MSKRFDEAITRGCLTSPEEYTYDYPTMEDDDEAIEEFIEKKRQEYYREWFSYVKDFE